jgi:hypothetical protein
MPETARQYQGRLAIRWSLESAVERGASSVTTHLKYQSNGQPSEALALTIPPLLLLRARIQVIE